MSGQLSGCVFRPISEGDADLIGRHRHEMFKASGRTDEILAPMTEAFAKWLVPQLTDDAYFGWIAHEAGVDIAGLGMMVIDWPPHPSHPAQDRRGYILNVFVEPEHRGRGIARALMGLATDEGRRLGLEYLVLHATAMARPMYEKLGWRQTSEMAIDLRRSSPTQ
ncbi:MAG: GNAT family N-acetyltransferase [Phenylobacterium sp.]|uniref:GNAT family N-acetyltransferase n=1 Tax=Phenylobacterium sp. TaxID=1871053 RepID=UPI0027322DC8|nr:GNAT family N-acetyltransferase [Phenylobacterium sp.]MDP3175484.1 GNAT family N-acetyltransferase [Phenylobacterium sp.]